MITQPGMSLVVPFLNEAEGMNFFCATIDKYIGQLSFPCELIFVDDGSLDDSVGIILNYCFKNPDSVKILKFSRNYGSHMAIRAGFLNAKFDICTWICCDLQEPLELIPYSYNRLISEDIDVIYISKEEINVNWIERLFSKWYYFLMRNFAIWNYPEQGIGSVIFNHKIKTVLNNNIESNSAILLQILNAGFKYDIVPMKYSERKQGVSKWTMSKKIKTMIDSFCSFSFVPIRLVSIIGCLIFVAGLVFGISAIINKMFNPKVPVGYSSLISVMGIGFGITNISLGIIAEYLWRTYEAARRRPPFIISDIIELKGYCS